MLTLLAPAALLFGLLAIPLMVLYMLRMRRRETSFSSLYLWRQALRDMQANTPWQKLRRNLLLVLQLLALLALTLALARPALRTPSLSGQNSVALLDASASMQAVDVSPTRFQAAVQRLHALIDTLPDGARLTIILAGARPVPLVSSTDRTALHAALQGIHPENGSADWQAALALAAGSVQQNSATVLLLFSDGGLPEERLPPFPGTVRYLPVGAQNSNLAVAALAARYRSGNVTLFARIHNYGGQTRRTLLSIYAGETLLHAERLTVPPHGDQSISLSGLPDLPAAYRAQLHPEDESPDYLPLDDTAYAVYQPERSRRVLLVTPGNLFLEQVLAALPAIRAYRVGLEAGGQPQSLLPQERFDAYVYDGLLPASLPPGNLLLVNPPPNPLFTVGAPYTPTLAASVAEHPLTSGLDWSRVFVGRARRVEVPPWGVPLVQTGQETLVFAGEYRGRRIGVLAFDLHDSTLPLTVAYPVLFARLMDYLAPGLPIRPGTSLRPGETLSLHPGVDTFQLVIVAPEGKQYTLTPQGGALTFPETYRPGVYAINVFGSARQIIPEQAAYFAVNLFDSGESDIQPAENIRIPHSGGDPLSGAVQGRRELWPWLASFAFLVLLVEWGLARRMA